MNLGTGGSQSCFGRQSAASDRRQFLERIEHLQAGPAEVLVVSRHDRQTMAPSGRGDVAVLHGHTLPVLLQQVFLIGPDMSDRDVEAENAPAERVDRASSANPVDPGADGPP